MHNAGFIICFYCLDKTLSYISIHTNNSLENFLSSVIGKIALIGFSFIVLILTGFLFSKIKNENICNLWKWALLVIILAALSNGFVQGAKMVFDRTRYRAMVYAGDLTFENYNEWFIFNKNKFEFLNKLLK